MKTPQENAQKPGATEIDLCAADWLQRQAFWNWGQDDQACLDAWLAESRAHRIAYWRQKAVWDNAQRLIALRLSAPRQDGLVENRKPVLLRTIAFAIALAVIGISGSFYLLRAGANETVYATRVGGHRMVTLADGSQVELNTDTVLRLRVNAKSRLAFLEKGEAFFDIRHSAAHPFVVDAAGRRITDLGTKFSVRNTPDRLEVLLVEGRARFESTGKSNDASAVLLPGDVAVATAHATTIVKKPQRELANELGWRRGRLTFYRATVADAANEFNRYNERKIVVADKAAASELIDGTFPTNDVDLFGRIARSVLGLQVKNEGGEIIISR